MKGLGFMKKIVTLLLAVLLVIGISGCSSEKKDEPKQFDTGYGLVLTLPSNCKAEEVDEQTKTDKGINFSFSNEDALQSASDAEFAKKVLVVLGGVQSFESLGITAEDIKSGDITLYDYAVAVADDENLKVTDHGGYCDFDYVLNDIYYKVATWMSDKDFYFVNYACYDSSTEMKALIDQYIKQVTVK